MESIALYHVVLCPCLKGFLRCDERYTFERMIKTVRYPAVFSQQIMTKIAQLVLVAIVTCEE
jgi:hypothetical protein